MVVNNSRKKTAYKGEFRLRKAQSGIPKNYVITKIDPIRAGFREYPDVISGESFSHFYVS